MVNSPAKILITGATGFVGQHLLKKLQQLYSEAICYAIVRPNSRSNNQLPDSVIQISADLADPNTLHQILFDNYLKDLEGAVIFHSAALLSANQGWKGQYQRINIDTSEVLAEVALKIHAQQFVFLSSMGAAGPVGTKSVPMDENISERPISIYSKSKLKAELLLKEKLEGHVPLVIFRPPNIYGPAMNLSSGAALMFKGMTKFAFPILGRGHNILNMIYVDNLIDAIVTISPKITKGSELFFIRDDSTPTTREFLTVVKTKFGSNTRFLPIPGFILWLPVKLMDLLSILIHKNIGFNSEILIGGTSDRYNFSIDKAKKYGYLSPTSLEDAITKTCDFIRPT